MTVLRRSLNCSDRERLKALQRRVNKARKFPANTCPASRHLHIMADALVKSGYPMLQEEPVHCAESIYAVLASLWEARSENAKDAERFRFLQNLPVVKAQAYFWGYGSRRERAAAIDQAMLDAAVAALVK
jgi:hypothetical protein